MTKAPTGVTRTFDITARQFSYDIEPYPFSVAAGDTVVIRATSGDFVHGLAMSAFLPAITLSPGTTETRTFVADKPGKYYFSCSSYCGFGHFGMGGEFFVYSPDTPPPVIDTIAPVSAPVNGAMVEINGNHFARDTRVRIGETDVTTAFVSATQIYAVAFPHAPGVVPLIVVNADGQFARTEFIYEAPPVPSRRRAVRP
jgi:cytochrome c oxidase subunit 2